MGAWGHGYFDNDAALDFMEDVEEATNPKKKLLKAFAIALKADYLEYDEGCAVIVAAAYVDNQVHGTTFSSPDQDEPLGVDTFSTRHPNQDFSDLREKAVGALKKLLDDNSELNELWAENEVDYPAWRQGIEELTQRLNNSTALAN